ncbi:MAG: DUF1848 family protein [Candidatus Helarchaeota archaeon]
MKSVISASRRTDIPAFYLDWFIDKMRKGEVRVKNPFYPQQVSRISLKKEDVHSIVFWSKDFGPFLEQASEFSDYNLFFHFTINDCKLLEPNVIPLHYRLRQLEKLAAEFNPATIIWRFDPIAFWRVGDRVVNNLGSFEKILEVVARVGLRRCYFSFVTWYEKSIRRARKHDIKYIIPSRRKMIEVSTKLASKCKEKGIRMYSCCNDVLLDVPNVYKGHCIDGEFLSLLFMEKCSIAKAPTREQCGCTKNRDVGDYREQLCRHGCIYCYASPII